MHLLSMCVLSLVLSCCQGRVDPNFRIRAVNLGGWLVTEGWIKPSLFDGIVNKDFLVWRLNPFFQNNHSPLYTNSWNNRIQYIINSSSISVLHWYDDQDGTALQFKSVTTGKYLSAEQGGGSIIVANRTTASGWETFRVVEAILLSEQVFSYVISLIQRLWLQICFLTGMKQLWRINETAFNFRVFGKQFIGVDTDENGIGIVAIPKAPGHSETFEILRNSDDKNRVRIKAPNGYYLQVIVTCKSLQKLVRPTKKDLSLSI